MKFSFSVLALAGTLACIAAAPAAHAQLALEYTSGGGITTSGANTSVGWSFTVNTSITIDALAALRVDGRGNEVRLYDSTGTTLASQVIFNTDPTTGSPQTFFTHAIAPLILTPGTYFVAQDVLDGETLADSGISGLTTNPAITYLGGVYAFANGLNPLIDPFSGGFGTAYVGPNFNIVGTTAVPEPGTCGLIAGMLVPGAAVLLRRRK